MGSIEESLIMEPKKKKIDRMGEYEEEENEFKNTLRSQNNINTPGTAQGGTWNKEWKR